MNLTPAQKTALAAHIRANTNSGIVPGTGGIGTFVINAAVNGRDPTLQQGIADWYNQPALAGDNQPFANLNVWNPLTNILQLNSAIKWQTAPVGATAADVTNSWLLWQTMIWSMGSGSLTVGLDMGDASVRKGMLQVFGDVANGSAAAIGAVGCGQQVGRNIELVCSNAVVGATTALTAAHPIQKDANGLTIYGQKLTQADVDNALFPG